MGQHYRLHQTGTASSNCIVPCACIAPPGWFRATLTYVPKQICPQFPLNTLSVVVSQYPSSSLLGELTQIHGCALQDHQVRREGTGEPSTRQRALPDHCPIHRPWSRRERRSSARDREMFLSLSQRFQQSNFSAID